MYLTNRNRRVIHIYNGKSVTKVDFDRPGSICGEILLFYCGVSKILLDFKYLYMYINNVFSVRSRDVMVIHVIHAFNLRLILDKKQL